jgi:hypothetical protein
MNGKKIVDMMQTAHEAGRSVPSIVFETSTAGRVKFYRQTERSKNPGAISMNDGGPKGADVWFGSINLDGSFRPTRACSPAVREVIAAFSEDPGGYAAAYGKGSARCCFCSTEITTAESKAVGYGPVCAENYGLPWGATWSPAAVYAHPHEDARRVFEAPLPDESGEAGLAEAERSEGEDFADFKAPSSADPLASLEAQVEDREPISQMVVDTVSKETGVDEDAVRAVLEAARGVAS